IKQGTGILSLYGTQSYSGSTTVSGGELSSAVAMSSTSYTINGGTFRMAASNIVPTSSNFDLSSGTLTYDNSQTINNLTVSGGTLNVAAGQTLTVNGTLTINGATTITLNSTGKIVYGASGKLIINTALTTTNDIWPVTLSEQPKDVTIGANVTLHAARSVSNALILTTGTFTNTNTLTMLNGSTITRTNGALSDPPSITSGNYAVIYNGSANITSGTSSTPELNPSGGSNVGSITINLSSSSFTVNTSTGAAITSAGGVTISRGTLALGNTLRLTGDWSMANTGAGFTPGTQTVNFNGSGSQAITVTGTGGGSTTFYILQMQKGGGTLSFGANTTATVTNSLFLSFGTFNNGSSLTVSGGASVSRQNGTLSAAPTYGSNVNVAFNSGTNANSGFELQPSAGSINNLSVASAIYTLAGNAVINGSVTINSGTLATSTFNINLKGAWTRAAAASFTSSGTVTFDGTSAQTITLTGGGTETFNNLTISNTNVSGVSPSTSNATSLAINGILSVSSGSILDMVTNALTGSSFTTSGTGTLRTQNTGTALPSGRTWSMAVQYNANGAQNIAGGTYSNGLTCSNTSIATKTMAADASVSEALSLSTSKLALNGNTLTLNGTVSGMSASNSLVGSNTSKLTVTSTSSVGSIFFDQTTSSDVATTNGTNALQNFVQSGSGGSVTLGNKLNLFNRLSVSAGTLNTGDNLVLRSISSNTAYVDQVGGTISGQVTVERYYHKQFRGWRMATAPVTFNGIANGTIDNVFNNWQSNFGYSNNYGTRLTANVTPSGTNGIDDQTNSSNLLTYNSSGSGSWNKVVNTKTETISGSSSSAANKGFFIFIRGDRTVIPNGSNINTFVTTTLAAKGLLQTGTQTFNFSGTSGNSWLIGNPYACPVDMSAITYNNIGNFVYFWDPNLTGATTNSPGTYTYFDRSNWGLGPVSGSSSRYFQSGQGFLVKPTSGTASITFSETNKTTSANNNTQTTGTINASTDIFNIKLFAVQPNGDLTNVDGLRAKFGNYADDVDDDDCIKIAATIESISLTRSSKNLAIEARPFITTMDTLFLAMNNMSSGSNYEFFVNPVNFDASVSGCKLIDNFLNTETPISLTSNTSIPFSISSVSGSNASNRFKIVFTGAGALPNNKLLVSAHKQNNTVVVDWKTSAEVGVK
ncbi:MAG: hypothetical protein NTZ59_10995, partial [Bacteroidetes bacterium]|nr:hypothetical protein [Bacteroidota bacterium]